MRIIQVGVGGFGGTWLNVIKNTPEVQLVGMVDINADVAKQQCRQFGFDEKLYFPTLRAALRQAKADAAVVVTPPKYHRAPVVAALEAGLHVISEKPMAESMADCKAMVRAAIKYKRLYVVSQNYRYNPQMWTLANLIHSGRLGKVGEVKLDFYMGIGFGGFRQEMEYPLIVDMSIHHFDLIRRVVGSNAVSVSGAGWNPSWSHYKHDCSSTALFEMENGARVLYNGSWCCKGGFNDWSGNWQIGCEKGTVMYQNGTITVHHAPEMYEVISTENVFVRPPPKTDQAYVLDEFMRCVRDGGRPSTVCFDNVYSTAMVFATVQAMRTGKKVPVVDADIRNLTKGR